MEEENQRVETHQVEQMRLKDCVILVEHLYHWLVQVGRVGETAQDEVVVEEVLVNLYKVQYLLDSYKDLEEGVD